MLFGRRPWRWAMGYLVTLWVPLALPHLVCRSRLDLEVVSLFFNCRERCRAFDSNFRIVSFGLWTLEQVVRGYVGIHRGQKPIQVDGCRPHRMSLHRLSQALSYPEPLRVTGPLQSLVLRTEDMWQKYKPFFIEVFGILNQGFPF